MKHNYADLIAATSNLLARRSEQMVTSEEWQAVSDALFNATGIRQGWRTTDEYKGLDAPRDVKEFAEELADAYSTGHYRGGWSACIKMLRKRGYNDREIEAIIRSKWTRWALTSDIKSHSAQDLARYMDENKLGRAAVEELTREHFND